MVFYFLLLESTKLGPMGKNYRKKNLTQYIEKVLITSRLLKMK